MMIRYEENHVHFDEFCSIEEADELQRFLETQPDAEVSLRKCQHLHTALLQLLLAYRPRVRGETEQPFLRKWIVPMLQAHRGQP